MLQVKELSLSRWALKHSVGVENFVVGRSFGVACDFAQYRAHFFGPGEYLAVLGVFFLLLPV